MRRADFLRAKDSFLNLVVKSAKLSAHLFVADAQMVLDVFEEHNRRPAFPDDARNMRPEVPRVFRPALFPGATERLTRVASNDDIHDSAPRAAIEGLKIAPNSRLMEASVFHTRCQLFNGSCFVFHETDRASTGNSQADSEIEASDAGAQAENVDLGRTIHTGLVRGVPDYARLFHAPKLHFERLARHIPFLDSVHDAPFELGKVRAHFELQPRVHGLPNKSDRRNTDSDLGVVHAASGNCISGFPGI
jgi:hypothetical protein